MAARLGEKGRVYALFTIVVIACGIGSLSQTVMNSMLGGIEESFGVDASVAQWLTTSYMLVMGITVPVVTFLSRRFSPRGLMFLTFIIFFAGAMIAFIAPNFATLIVGRILQAIATGITLPFMQSIAMTRFPVGKNGTAMGIAGISLGAAPNIAPLIGGALVDTWGWRSYFLLLVAVIAALAIASFLLIEREDTDAHNAGLDIVSLLLSTLGFGGMLLSFSNAANMDVVHPFVWLPLVVGIVCVVLFIYRQRHIDRPLINLSIFSSRRFRIGFIEQNLLFASFMGITLVVPLYVQGLCGGSAFDAGLVFMPATIIAVIMNPVAGILADKIGSRKVVIFAGCFIVIGSVSMIFVDEQTPLWLLAFMQAIRGFGVSSLVGPVTSWSLSDLPHETVMDGSAFATTVRQACASLGTALMVFIITMAASGVFSGVDMLDTAAIGYQLAFGLSALFSVCLLVVAIWKVR